MPARAVYSTLAADEIAQVVETAYGRGSINSCTLLRRGFNDVYEFRLADGQLGIARLSSRRPRGSPNVAYETALLLHLAGAGASVAVPWTGLNGAAWVEVQAAEGRRALVVFDHLDGTMSLQNPDDAAAIGSGLATIHNAAEGYEGPPSMYHLELPYLLHRPLAALLNAPTLDESLRDALTRIGERTVEKLGDVTGLSMVHCHGDCHGGNNVVTQDENAVRQASFFDFDDSGPGFLAYDLAVYLWTILRGPGLNNVGAMENWKSYLRAYSSVRAFTSADFEAIISFAVVRQLWFLGEYAGRVHEWGTQVLPRHWLQHQVELMNSWGSLHTPEY